MADRNTYLNKKTKTTVQPTPKPTPTISLALSSSSIKTNVRGESAVVRKSDGTVLQHINLKNVAMWWQDANYLIIKTTDNIVPIQLGFDSPQTAKDAEIRFTSIKNGNILS